MFQRLTAAQRSILAVAGEFGISDGRALHKLVHATRYLTHQNSRLKAHNVGFATELAYWRRLGSAGGANERHGCAACAPAARLAADNGAPEP